MPDIKKILIVRADGQMRIANTLRRLNLRPDEVAYPVVVSIPSSWGKYYEDQELRITMPGAPMGAQVKTKAAVRGA